MRSLWFGVAIGLLLGIAVGFAIGYAVSSDNVLVVPLSQGVEV
jgi:Na+/H+-dicarboxylate symporter